MHKCLVVVLLWLLSISATAFAQSNNHYPVTITDAIDRRVTIAAEPKAVLLGSGFNLVALSLIHPDPVSILSAWASDMMGDNPEIYQRFKDKFPEIAQLPIIGDGITISTEAALSVKSDLVIMAKWQADSETGRLTIQHLEELGIATIIVDFNEDTLNNTAKNMRMLGQALNRVEQANAYADFYEARIKLIRDRAAELQTPKPKVLLTAFPDEHKCCYAFGSGGLGAFITLVGGENVAENLAVHGDMMNAEAVLVSNPDVLIATSSPGGTYSALSVGPGVPESEARQTLERIIANPFLASSPAISQGRVHGLWNFFNAVPINVLAAEVLAKWINPELYHDIDPEKTMQDINQRFAAVPFDGAYWVDLKRGD